MNKAFLEVTVQVAGANRARAGAVYAKYKAPFLATIAGAQSKDLLVRDEDVQVLHGFNSRAAAEGYLTSALFESDVVRELAPCLIGAPEIRIYECR